VQSIDIALFTLINAGAGTPRWAIQSAIFISDVLPALAVGVFALAAVAQPAWRKPLLAALVSVLLAWALVRLFRSVVHVPRPAALGLGTQWTSQGPRPGFPSMHVTTSFAFAITVLFARLRGPGVAFLLLALLVGWSRVFLGLHFPSDVCAGAMLGALLGAVVHLARRGRPLRPSSS